jgi:hypothetical protein
MLNINGVHQPFYVSTGAGEKEGVATGKWYPFFGIGKDGWFNKTSEADINNYYGSEALKAGAEFLNANYPSGAGFRFKNMLDDAEEKRMIGIVNKSMPVTPRSHADHGSTSHLDNIKKNGGMGDSYG